MRNVYIALLVIPIIVIGIAWIYPKYNVSLCVEESTTKPEERQTDREGERKFFFSHSNERNKQKSDAYYRRLKELKLALLTSIQEQSEKERLQNPAGDVQDLQDENINKEHISEVDVSDEQQIDPDFQPSPQEIERAREEEKKRKELLADLESRYQNDEESIDSIGSKNIESDLLEAMTSLEIPVSVLGGITCQHTSCKVEFVLDDIQKGAPLLQLGDEAPGEQIFDIAQNDEGQSIVTSYFAREGFNLKGEATDD